LGSDDERLGGVRAEHEVKEFIPTKKGSLFNALDVFDDKATSSAILATIICFFDNQSEGWSKYNILFAIGYIKINKIEADIRITITMLFIK
jgi:hypothetical protein